MKTIWITCLGFIVILATRAFALDGDIVDFTKANHPVCYVDDKLSEYGSPDMDRAVKELSDIQRPWTVPKMITLFTTESEAYVKRLRQRIADKDPTMWSTSLEEADRCGYLATVLAASRDPRAAVALRKVYEIPNSPARVQIIIGFNEYFLSDKRYKQVPPSGPYASTNLFRFWQRDVKAWSALNKEIFVSNEHSPNR